MPEENKEAVQVKVQPYQDGDLILDDRSRLKQYAGPIFDVTYPPTVDSLAEENAWDNLGYRTLISYTYDAEKGFTIRVMGDIPEWVKANMKKNGIKCTLTKERGPIIDIG